MSPAKLFKVVAVGEAVTWTLLLAGMIGKYAAHLDWATKVGGGIHGFVFLCYVATVAVLSVDHRWKPAHVAAGIGSAIVPYLTLWFERYAAQLGLESDPWQLGGSGRAPATTTERVVAWAIRKPVAAVGVGLVVVAVVFVALLALGNPKDLIAGK